MTAAFAQLDLETEDETTALGACIAPLLDAGDTILLVGDIGAGKSTLARAIVQTRLSALGRQEDVPSPTFTLVQVYDLDTTELWHCDLYRLSDPQEVDALGLTDAFDTAICLVEWPDRLGDAFPEGALILSLARSVTGEGRVFSAFENGHAWRNRLSPCFTKAA